MARARLRTSQNAWTSGEIDPELEGRQDQERYFKSAMTLENFKLRPLGGVTRRPGTTYVTSAKTDTLAVQLVPFIARQTAAYALEFGEMAGSGYIRFYRNNGQILSSPNLVTNGDYAAGLTGWTATGVATATGGVGRLPTGGDKVTNGSFTTAMTGWNQTGVTSVSGVAQMAADVSFMNQNLTGLVPSTAYTLTFQVVQGTVTVSLSNSTFTAASYAPGLHTFTVQPTATTALIQFDARPSPGGLARVDNVSLIQQSSLSQTMTVVAGTVYELRFRLISGAATVRVIVSGNVFADNLDAVLAAGTYTYPVASTSTSLTVLFLGVGDIDDVSLQAPAAPHEISSPYLAGDLPHLRWAPSADVLYLACEGYAPRKLSRTSDTGWTLALVNFRPPATEEKPVMFPDVTLTLSAVTGTGVTATATGGAPFLSGDVDRQIRSGVGRAIIQAFTSTTVVTVDIIDDFTSTVLPPMTWTLNGSPNATLTPSKKEPTGAAVTLTATTLNVFRASDVGKYVRIHNGMIRITKYTSGLIVTGEILHKLEAITGTTAWSLEVPSWDDTDGWPVDVGFTSGDRLAWARGDRIWLSVVGDYEVMNPSTLDDDAFTLAMRTAEVSEIRGIVGATELQLFSSGAEFVVAGGNDQPITPTNFKIGSDTTYGAARNRVIRVNGQTIFVDRSGRGLREQVFDISVNRHVAVDLLQLAQHLFPIGKRIVEIGYQRSPDSLIWALRNDGVLCALTYLRPEGVVGWWRMVTAGTIESFCIIPHPDGDREQVWLAVGRQINGAAVRYIERIDDTSVFSDTTGRTYGAKNTDATLSYTGPAIQIVGGLEHLEGVTVDVLAGLDGTGPDERDLGQFVVVGGQIDLGSPFTPLEIGLHYDATLVTVRPEVQVQGTSQMVKKRNARIGVRLHRSKRLKANGNFLTIPPGVPFSGDVITANLGWDRDGRITLVSDRPWPTTILMLSSVMGVGV